MRRLAICAAEAWTDRLTAPQPRKAGSERGKPGLGAGRDAEKEGWAEEGPVCAGPERLSLRPIRTSIGDHPPCSTFTCLSPHPAPPPHDHSCAAHQLYKPLSDAREGTMRLPLCPYFPDAVAVQPSAVRPI